MDPDGPMLQVHDLSVSFPLGRSLVASILRRPQTVARAVDGVSFTVSRGEIVALVGESGSGKTTTGHAVLGLLDGYRGEVRFDGQRLSGIGNREMRRLRRRMQMVYQDPFQALNPRFTVQQAVAEPLLIHGIQDDREGRIVRSLAAAGLSPAEQYLQRRPHELSGGQRQRVAIAASLTLEPDLLVADEPVSMLDVSVRAGVLEVFAGLRDRGMGILMITHDLATAAHFADRIQVMYLGRIVEQGLTREVIADPSHPYTRALLAAVPDPDPRQASLTTSALRGEAPDATAIPSGCRFHPRCPVARDVCPHSDPQLRSVSPTHAAACVLVGDGAIAAADHPEESRARS